MGQQSQLMWVGIAGYWGCGVPLGYTLAFHTNLQLAGLWFGALTGALIVGEPLLSSRLQLVVYTHDVMLHSFGSGFDLVLCRHFLTAQIRVTMCVCSLC